MKAATVIFDDRVQAGRLLGERLRAYEGRDVVVLGLPRGGVPVADQVARMIGAPLDVLIVRKIGLPMQPEVAMGAVGEGGVCVRNEDTMALAHVSDEAFVAVEMRELGEIERRSRRYRGARSMTPLTGRIAIIVDDGIATGSTAAAAVQVAREHGAARVVVATPISAADAARDLARVTDDLVAVQTPRDMLAVGYWYRDFSPTSDLEVERILTEAAAREEPDDPTVGAGDDVQVPFGIRSLEGHLVVPDAPIGVVVFAHGNGSSRHSPADRVVADGLHRHRIATLQLDLCTAEERRADPARIDVELGAARLLAATAWLRSRPVTAGLPIGFFGTHIGSAAAMRAALRPGADVAAIVSCGGRPDLVGDVIELVDVPTLLLVGSDDADALERNRTAAGRLAGPHRMVTVPDASQRFEEPGALDLVRDDACIWFLQYFTPR